MVIGYQYCVTSTLMVKPIILSEPEHELFGSKHFIRAGAFGLELNLEPELELMFFRAKQAFENISVF